MIWDELTLTNVLKPVAEAFVQARLQARVLDRYPGARPQDLAEAYHIQDHAISIDGRAVAGWKVGRIFPPDDERLGSNRIAGPIFADTLANGERGCPEMPVFAGGFAAVEAEFLLHIAPGHAGAAPRGDDETRAILDDIRIGLEIASSPYPGINADGPAVTASDFGNNAGLVIGPSLADWHSRDLCSIVVETRIDGQRVGRETAAAMLDGPFGAIRFLLANLSARGIDIAQGAWVSTGAVTGVHPVLPGQRVEAIFESAGSVACTVTAAAGR